MIEKLKAIKDRVPHPVKERRILREFDAIPKEQLYGLTIEVTMDGNARFAKKTGIPLEKGHAAGANKGAELTRFILSNGMNLILWGFSTDNWKRPEEERENIFRLIDKTTKESLEELIKSGARVIHLGRKDRIPEYLRETLIEAEEKTKDNKGPILALAVDYSGRDELERAAEKSKEEKSSDSWWQSIRKHCDDKGLIPDGLHDKIIAIRTGGDKRTSGFGFRIDFAELYFTTKQFPELTITDIKSIVVDYFKRDKRFGGRPNNTK